LNLNRRQPIVTSAIGQPEINLFASLWHFGISDHIWSVRELLES
jgi:hypothetical protein